MISWNETYLKDIAQPFTLNFALMHLKYRYQQPLQLMKNRSKRNPIYFPRDTSTIYVDNDLVSQIPILNGDMNFELVLHTFIGTYLANLGCVHTYFTGRTVKNGTYVSFVNGLTYYLSKIVNS